MKSLTTHARKIVVMTAAAVCIVLGLLTVWTPLPTGIPLLAIGIVLLATVSATARRLLKRSRGRWRVLDTGMVMVESRTGRQLSTMLKRTRPLSRKAEAKAAMRAAEAALRNAASSKN
ncbi:hypothetical protein [Acuticoccus mangrovi]|uniref:Uncharacterized protein n=1 Tax=Acuticoccus mangrovi TaxID=2796142 RepID=A0A934IH53_9HYPH|nr:hypothetical protein [Acuticoccus mangrovi]MBJ3774901.1 hypothetical protein [Acuticoccus mangrovi]